MITPCAVLRWWVRTSIDLVERGVRHIILAAQETEEDKQAMIDMLDSLNAERGHPAS